MLPEDKRKQLDGIVQQMATNKESDDNIRFVVDDFKKKYTPIEAPKIQPKQKDGFLKSLVTDPFKSLIVKPAVRTGQAIGALGVNAFGNEDQKSRLDNALSQPTNVPTPLGNVQIEPLKSGVSGYKQVAGESLQAGAEIAGLASGAPKAGTALGRIGANAAVGAGLGAAGGASSGLQEDKGAGEIFKRALISGTIGGVLGGGVSALGEAAKLITSKQATSKIYNTGVKPTLSESRKAIKYNGDTLGDELINRGVYGNDKKLLNYSGKQLQANEDKLQSILSKNGDTIKRSELEPYLDSLIATKDATPGLKSSVEQIKGVLQEFPEEVPVAQANQIKRNLYNALGDVAFRLDPNLSTKRDAMKALAKGIKEQIETKTSDNLVNDVAESTVGMATQYQPILEGVKVVPPKVSGHIVDDITSKLKYRGMDEAAAEVKSKLGGQSFRNLDEIQKRVMDIIGDNPVKSINQELSVFGRLNDRMIDKIARANRNNLIGLTDTIAGTGGAIVGGALGGPVGVGVGALAMEGTKKALGSTLAKTGGAVALDRLGSLIRKIPTDTAGRVSKATLVNLLKQLTQSQ